MRLKILLCSALSLLAVTTQADEPKVPFTLTVVPSRSGADERNISTAEKQPPVFYVVLTNVSDHPQPVWETRCSWGYQTISFEIILPDGKRLSVTQKPKIFTVNPLAVFVVPAGEQQVYPIQLNVDWENCPLAVTRVGVPVTLKAIYSVVPTPESTAHGVWTGRTESASYQIMLNEVELARPPA